jgi:hypothetical protein
MLLMERFDIKYFDLESSDKHFLLIFFMYFQFIVAVKVFLLKEFGYLNTANGFNGRGKKYFFYFELRSFFYFGFLIFS